MPGGWSHNDFVFEPLNGAFGMLVAPKGSSSCAAESILADESLCQSLVQAWQAHGGLLVLRGLVDLTPGQLVAIGDLFGVAEPELDQSKQKYQVEGFNCVMRIGNTRNDQGELTALFAKDIRLPPSGSPQYRADERKPVWHTDSTYRKNPPIGSLLFCKQAPPEGAATCFADMRAALDELDKDLQARIEGLECVCSLAHHDAKVNKSSPDFPVLTPEQRLANPPVRVPMVLPHPLTGRKALYGMNSSTCVILPKGMPVSEEQMEKYELETIEHPSVQQEWRSLLPFVTSDRFTVKWQWAPGDLVLWDNRCTIHCATGFEDEKYTREMWRLTLAMDRA